MIKVQGTVFKRRMTHGDFEWMISQPTYDGSLFIFNDNIEEHHTTKKGIGNACIRPYTNHRPIRAAGIPTGSRKTGGFLELSDSAKSHIDHAITEIYQLCMDYGYHTIYYSQAGPGNQLLGTSIFKVGFDVLSYITQRIIFIPRAIRLRDRWCRLDQIGNE